MNEQANVVRMLRSILRAIRPSAEPAPLKGPQRARLEHRARGLRREVRQLEKALAKRGCSSCPNEVDEPGLRAARRASELRNELHAIERRLSLPDQVG